MTVLDKLSDGEGILVDGAGGESLKLLLIISFDCNINLVGHIEENKEFFLLADCGELFPLFWKRIDTSRVVSASVEDNNGAVGDLVAELIVAAGSVEAASAGVVVRKVVDLVAAVGEDWVVVAPGRSRKKDSFSAAESVEVSGTDSKGAGARNSLGGDGAAVGDNVASISKSKVGSGLGEGGKTFTEGQFAS